MASARPQISQIRDVLLEIKLIGNRARLGHIAMVWCFCFGFFAAWIGMQYQGVPEVVTPLANARHLAAETLAQGKLSIPAGPGAEFMQTYLTLQSPVYAAAIPLGEVLPMALGYMVHDPLLGLWIGAGFLCAATAWMIRGFASLRWALIGAAFTAIWMCAFSYWAQSYDGYLAAASGIALTWGAVRRYMGNPRRRYALALGVAIGWSSFCMPLSLPFASFLPLVLWFKSWWRRRRSFADCGVLLVGFSVFAVIQGLVNNNVTGSCVRTPSSLYRVRYDNNPYFLWEKKFSSPDFDFVRMEQYDLLVSEAQSMLPTPVGATWSTRVVETIKFYVGYPVLFLLFAAVCIGLTQWARWLLGAFVVALSPIFFVLPYELMLSVGLAALAPLLFVWSLRRLMVLPCVSRRIGLPCLVTLGVVVFILALVRGVGRKADVDVARHLSYRKELSEYLLNEEQGRHVVIVSYDPQVSPHVEYVYNSADIDGQPIVWARWNEKMNGVDFYNRFNGRKMWMLWVSPGGMPELKRFQWKTGLAQ